MFWEECFLLVSQGNNVSYSQCKVGNNVSYPQCKVGNNVLHNNVPLMTHGREPCCSFFWAMDGDNRIPNNVFRVADGGRSKLQNP